MVPQFRRLQSDLLPLLKLKILWKLIVLILVAGMDDDDDDLIEKIYIIFQVSTLAQLWRV
jgi:hypothetical protein